MTTHRTVAPPSHNASHRALTPEDVATRLGGVGYMSPDRGRLLSSFIRDHHLTSVLELGFAHGGSTCYLASAVGSCGGGSVTSIDLENARARRPTAEELLERCGWRHLVELIYEPTSYTWRLMRFLEQESPPSFDLCFVDGAHRWADDGFAFFLVDRLLAPGGWLIFDDLDWTFDTSPSMRSSEVVAHMPEDERTTAQIRKVYELLVKRQPGYGEFRVDGPWAFARKLGSDEPVPPLRTETVYATSPLDHLWTKLRSFLVRT